MVDISDISVYLHVLYLLWLTNQLITGGRHLVWQSNVPSQNYYILRKNVRIICAMSNV